MQLITFIHTFATLIRLCMQRRLASIIRKHFWKQLQTGTGLSDSLNMMTSGSEISAFDAEYQGDSGRGIPGSRSRLSQEKIDQINQKYGLVYTCRNKKAPEITQKEQGASTEKEMPSSAPPAQIQQRKTVGSSSDIDLTGWANNAKVPVPLVEIVKIPVFKQQIGKALGFEVTDSASQCQRTKNDPPLFLSSTFGSNGQHEPFFVSLVVTDWILHNCMMDTGAGMNVMSLEVANKMGLKTSRPYRNVCAFDSQEIPTIGVIKDLQVHLARHPDVMITMDVVVLDIPAACGMWLSREWSAKLGGTLQMDLSYATIPTPDGKSVTLFKEAYRQSHVEDPRTKKKIWHIKMKDLEPTQYLQQKE
jgi:hypothetical protein